MPPLWPLQGRSYHRGIGSFPIPPVNALVEFPIPVGMIGDASRIYCPVPGLSKMETRT